MELADEWLSQERNGMIHHGCTRSGFRINAIKAKIDETSSNSKCRLCKVKEESIDHLVRSCSKIAQTDYKERHNKVASMLHWKLCRKNNLPTINKWWEHKVDKVLPKKDVKIL